MLAATVTLPAVAAGSGAPGEVDRDRIGHRHHEAPAEGRYSRSLVRYLPPDVPLRAMDGAETSLAAALTHDGPVFLQFIFTTCPGVCPALSAIFSAAQSRLGDDAARTRMVSISIDPEHDTPERLRDYARRFRAGPQWRFYTGAVDDVTAVQKAFDAYRGNKMRHEPATYLRTAPGETWLRLDGFPTAAELVAEYRRLAGP